METYKLTVKNEHNIQPLSDDYIKFIRFAQARIESTGYGVIGMITNSSYLSGLIHRGMREQLLKSFSEIFILDLHGSSMIDNTTPCGNKDENVFDIRQGVAIILLIKVKNRITELAKISYAEMRGLRENKYDALLSSAIQTTEWEPLMPVSPNFFFFPSDMKYSEEYKEGWAVNKIFGSYSTGIKTHRDHFAIDFEFPSLLERITIFCDKEISDKDIAERFNLRDTRDWNLSQSRNSLCLEQNREKWIRDCLYRPFDIRQIYYHPKVLELPRPEVMNHMLIGENLALLACRQQAETGFYHILCTNKLAECCAVSLKTREVTSVFPLYTYQGEDQMKLETERRQSNLNSEFIKVFTEKLSLKFISDGKGDLTETLGPEDIFNYAYAVFHSPTYRSRYAEFLKIDFPRLQLTSNKELFKILVGKGSVLVALHLMESPLLNTLVTKYEVKGDHIVEKVSYDENTQSVFINKTQYFKGVPHEVWNFHVGGYQVCDKWLKDRKGRKLSIDDINHYQKIVVALKETIRLMAEIDNIIPGWPIE